MGHRNIGCDHAAVFSDSIRKPKNWSSGYCTDGNYSTGRNYDRTSNDLTNGRGNAHNSGNAAGRGLCAIPDGNHHHADGNRMDKKTDVQYYPIADHAPLGNYVTIGEETQFEVDEEGCLVITFPAGTVTDEANGVQEFRIQRVATEQKG